MKGRGIKKKTLQPSMNERGVTVRHGLTYFFRRSETQKFPAKRPRASHTTARARRAAVKQPRSHRLGASSRVGGFTLHTQYRHIPLIHSVNSPLEAQLSQERQTHLPCKFSVDILTVVVIMKTGQRLVLVGCIKTT